MTLDKLCTPRGTGTIALATRNLQSSWLTTMLASPLQRIPDSPA
jgi:hypothetical protein